MTKLICLTLLFGVALAQFQNSPSLRYDYGQSYGYGGYGEYQRSIYGGNNDQGNNNFNRQGSFPEGQSNFQQRNFPEPQFYNGPNGQNFQQRRFQQQNENFNQQSGQEGNNFNQQGGNFNQQGGNFNQQGGNFNQQNDDSDRQQYYNNFYRSRDFQPGFDNRQGYDNYRQRNAYNQGYNGNDERYENERFYNGDYYRPPHYEFGYRISNPQDGTNYGHQENRYNDRTQGSYHVTLPDGVTQVVDYEADQEGYKPRISYHPPGN